MSESAISSSRTPASVHAESQERRRQAALRKHRRDSGPPHVRPRFGDGEGAANRRIVAEALVNSGTAQQAKAIAGDFARFGANADRVSGPLDAIVLRKQGIRGVLTRLLVRWGPGSPKVERSARSRASDRPFCDGSSAGGGRPDSGGGRAEPVGASRLPVSGGAVRTMRSWSSSGRRRTCQSSVKGPISG